MVKKKSKVNIGQCVRDAITATFPSAVISSTSAKHLFQNTRILLPSDASAGGNEGGVVLKLKKACVASIPRSRFAPIWMSTQDGNISILGARLTQHGGEVAVELARKIARKAAIRLVVLGTNIIAMSLLDMTRTDAMLNLVVKPDACRAIVALLEKLKTISDDFHARVDAMVS